MEKIQQFHTLVVAGLLAVVIIASVSYATSSTFAQSAPSGNKTAGSNSTSNSTSAGSTGSSSGASGASSGSSSPNTPPSSSPGY